MALFPSRIVQVATVPEVTWGVIPTSPTFQIERFLPGDGLQTKKGTQAIEELHVDPNVRDHIQLKQDVDGSHDFILSYGTNGDLWWTRILRNGTWATNVLVNGMTRVPFTLEEKFLAGAAAGYRRFRGVEVDKAAIRFEARKEVRATLSFVGQAENVAATAALSGATYTAAETNALSTGNTIVANAFMGLGTLPTLNSVELDIDHGIQPVEALGSLYRADQLPDLTRVTGKITGFILAASPGDVTDLSLNHASGDINFTVGSVANNKYTLDLPFVRITDAKVLGMGTSGALRFEVDFAADYDSSTGGSIKVTRSVA
ncbi:phage tail tube protein [Methylosinus sp. LW4]|uniref:phage tail tube protein n=1 Tax=Methylosinus sp. LW4 TaxID=136993 RepID=UPI000377A4EA|nr:phage tail tube protein [Methylosinus sp. LW4]